MSGAGRRTVYRKGVQDEVLNGRPEPEEGQCVVKVVASHGSNLFTVETADGNQGKAQLPTRFRKLIWVGRGSFLIASVAQGDIETADGSKGTVGFRVESVLLEDQVKHLMKVGKFPAEFEARFAAKRPAAAASAAAAAGEAAADDEGASGASDGEDVAETWIVQNRNHRRNDDDDEDEEESDSDDDDDDDDDSDEE